MKNLEAKQLIALSISLLLGFAGGFFSKDLIDKNITVAVPVHKVNNFLLSTNRLIAPDLWAVYVDPLWIPPAIPDLVNLSSDVPMVKIAQGANELRVSIPVPGLTEKDIDVQIGKDALTVKGYKKEDRKDRGSRIFEESIEQTIQLPCKVDEDKVKATIKNGVLTVSLPKADTNVAAGKKTTDS